jgi:hypothetical protein
LGHPPFAALTIMATAVSNGQLGITHAVPRSAMRTTKVKLRDGRRAAHDCILHVVSKSKSPARTRLLNGEPRGSWGAGEPSRNAIFPFQSSRLAEFGGLGMSFNIRRGTLAAWRCSPPSQNARGRRRCSPRVNNKAVHRVNHKRDGPDCAGQPGPNVSTSSDVVYAVKIADAVYVSVSL